jgi:hypothetical protein
MRIGIDAHKRSCTTCLFEEEGAGLMLKEAFAFEATRQGVREFMGRVPERSVVVIESSTTGKVLSRMLSGKYEVHMIAPPERISPSRSSVCRGAGSSRMPQTPGCARMYRSDG